MEFADSSGTYVLGFYNKWVREMGLLQDNQKARVYFF
jgi:hypothetical protein